MRALALDVIAVAVLAVYGTEVCPVLHELGGLSCGASLAGAFVIAHAASRLLERRWVDAGPEVRRAARTYGLTLGRYAAAGALVVAHHMLVLGHPIGSGLRLVVGVLTLGHFFGVDLALAKEREVMDRLADRGEALSAIEQPRSFVRRLLFFALGAVAATVAVVVLLLARDLSILAEAGMSRVGETTRSMVIEISIVGALLFVLAISTVTSFAKNLRRFLDNETRVLEAVSRGELGGRVPVLSDDEFGVIAAHTNRMIEGLCERQRVRDVLGKIVSPDVARALLEEQGLALGGERRTLALLFSDVRDFTAWSEGTAPEVLVRDLNRYFTEMVGIVHAHGGVVDKFIGDGMMAVFGLDGRAEAPLSATRAGLAMLEALEPLNAELTTPMAIGIGIHFGDVIAGNIGAPDRLEFTVIGDAVNTAARIESLTRAVDTPLLVSRALVDALDEHERGRWESRGAHPLKGKAAPVEVYAPAPPS